MKMRLLGKRLLSMAVCLALLVACLPGTVHAMIADNPLGDTVAEIPEDGQMDANYGTIVTNNGDVLENEATGVVESNKNYIGYNDGTVTCNEGTVYDNYGTISCNKATVSYNHGTVTDNQGTVEYNLCGTVNGGEVLNDYAYKIDVTAAPETFLSADSEDFEATVNVNNIEYVKSGVDLIWHPYQGLQFSGTPTATGGMLTKNEDGSYTISNITGDITLTAAVEFLPVSDIVEVPETGYIDIALDLSVATVQPANANSSFTWTIVDAGTTGATIADPEYGELLATAAGTVTVKASVEDGLAPGVPFEKTFTIEIVDPVPLVIEGYKAVQNALSSKDPDKLQPAIDSFSKCLSAFNGLTETQMAALAAACNVPTEDIFATVFVDWVTVNVLREVVKPRADFLKNPNADTAAAYIEVYEPLADDSIFEGLDEEARAFFRDFDALYTQAKQLLCKHNGKTVIKGKIDPTTKKNGYTGDTHCKLCDKVIATGKAIPKKETPDKKPGNHQTGDAGAPALWLALTVISGSALLTLAYYSKKKTT